MHAAGPRDCPQCGTRDQGRFCGRCGARQEPSPCADGSAAHDASGQPSALPDGPGPDRTIPRRTVLAAVGGVLVGGLLGSLMTRPAAPLDGEGLPTADLRIGAIDHVLDRIRRDGPLLLPDRVARLAVVTWDPSYRSEAGSALDRYGPEAEDHPIVDATTGLLVLSLLSSTHADCRVRFCEASQWFEEPCHGSRFNRWGEWTAGPAPRGLDRYRSRVTQEGDLIASLSDHIVGPHREIGILDQPSQGPTCVYD